MQEYEINEAVAKELGWRHDPELGFFVGRNDVPGKWQPCWIGPGGEKETFAPEFCNDRNAAFSVLEHLDDAQEDVKYEFYRAINDSTGAKHMPCDYARLLPYMMASPRVIAECFLKALGKWPTVTETQEMCTA